MTAPFASFVPDNTPPLPARADHAHKGTCGAVAIVGGSVAPVRMIGAPALSAQAAIRTGAGLTRLVCPEPMLNAAMTLCPAATGIALPVDSHQMVVPHDGAEAFDTVLTWADVIAIGPGFGNATATQTLTLRALAQESIPVVADADALNALARTPDFQLDLRAPAILTPHHGEFERLAHALGSSDSFGINTDRANAAMQLAQRTGCVIVLKGHESVVSDGLEVWTNTAPTSPCLATAGSGDVLTGIIAALVAQFVDPRALEALPGAMQFPKAPGKPLNLMEAAIYGVLAHGLCGAQWAHDNASDAGLDPADLTELIPQAMSTIRASRGES